ncbi:MAG: hypothetical protein HYY59_06965 [Candidatus Omnitrophica bacterium]|nr:hypothetical protein [Candidatus Omnitrophota bacterium]MBI3021718.1 hypothetical protein [Candidatus Omnitrophota bacterium]
MNPEELRVRSLYIFLACSQAIEQLNARLMATMPSSPPSVKAVFDKSLKKELALLVRYWATRQIWKRLEASEPDARNLNLALLRLFVEGFRLPRDGSGLRYAELSTVSEETRELSHRLTSALGMEHAPLLKELEGAMFPLRDAVLHHTVDALDHPLDQLSSSVKAWAERASPA